MTLRRKVSDDIGARDAAYADFDRGGIGDESTRFAFRAGWERAARLADEKDKRIAELEQVVVAVQALLPGERTFAQSLVRDHNGNPFPQLIDADAVKAALEPAGDVLARERAHGAYEALDTLGRQIHHRDIVLWHGDTGVSVDIDDPTGKNQPLALWLIDRADEHKQKAGTP
ncbi:hypothetical protein [Curtobacterium sp. MCSS17_016]|uniref:hypothetical protein n=1 Tax=Curtobacterium sp. MCSS17_016 TaxID=2175644 RepID=UPI000DAAC544|nr:hypothetical protein [Curtobacterium sp. MCSS17_016]WIE81031.1 hypothetical protein DEJ19_021175 [Curtobacterium sp. MCSS17_016]